MLKYLKYKFAGTEEKKRLVGNIFSLVLLQGTNYILPLITVRHLVRVLGPEYFGLLAFANATIMYFMLLTDYGFNLSATRQISIHREDKCKLNEIYSAVMIIKLALMLISFVLMALIVLSFEKFSVHWEVYFITFCMLIGQVISPIWLFQGMEQMKFITYLNIGAKVFFTVCVFLVVEKQTDYILVPFFNAMGFVVTGVISQYLVKRQFKVDFFWQQFHTLKFQLIEGWHVFVSSIAISFYTISTTFVLGLFTNNTIVGYFAGADKLVQAAKGIYAPISQAIFPVIGKKIHENRHTGLTFIQRITWVVGVGMFIISVLLFLGSRFVVSLLFGENYGESVLILQIMAFLPFVVALSNIYGIQTMLNLGYKKVFSHILLAAAILGIGLSLYMVPHFEGVGAAITMLIVEIFVTAFMYIYLKIRLKREL